MDVALLDLDGDRAAAEAGRLAFTTSSSILDPGSRLGAHQASTARSEALSRAARAARDA